MKKIKGGVTSPKGYQAAGVAAGIKYQDRDDMAIIVSDVPAQVAGTFTKNIVKAAPVKWCQEVVKTSKSVQAIIVNAGIANACTGEQGYEYCQESADEVAKALSISPEAVLIGSTGVIGKQLPIDKIKAGINELARIKSDSIESGTNAAKAIMTTDTMEKQLAIEVELSGVKVTIGGMCKGSGMIHPDMCTMLSFLTSDVAISKELLQKVLSDVVDDTYNMISVDGDTSTNDTVLLMANGMAGNTPIVSEGEDYQKFVVALKAINSELARKIAGDGEGATALFEAKVIGAKSKEQAVTISKSIITSSLTKAAIFGRDANWGRILCAMGYSGATFDPEKVDLFFESDAGKMQIIKDGVALDYSEEEATKVLSAEEVTVIADIKMGSESATAWGCDLTYDYIKINADYRS